MSKQLVEYMNIHLISLNQDLESLEDLPSNDSKYNYLTGAIEATRHLLSVADDMIRLPIERI